MAYTTIDKPTDYFNTKLYTGNGGTQSITGLDFQPDWVWIKERSGADDHSLYDSIRGVNQLLESNKTGVDSTTSSGISSFNSDGWTTGSFASANNNNDTYVSWNWKAGTSFTNDASSTSVGTIDSVGSVNTDAGFSIVSYTGTGANGSMAHGLGAKPQVIFTKSKDTAQNWLVQHKYSIGSDGWTDSLVLNLTNAADDDASYWNDTEPTSTVFSVGSSALSNKSSDAMIAYCFAEKQGYSKFGSYTGNGNANGTFTYTGFKPAWILIKRTDGAANWEIYDNKRLGYNSSNPPLYPDLTNAEGGNGRVDILSNGFKIVTTSGNLGGNGGRYVYLAFAEQPFVSSSGVPATAR